jgi:hypothetical protein
MRLPIAAEVRLTHYSVPQLAEITSESQAVWRKRILFRQIAYRKFGRNVRVSGPELERWLESRMVASIGGPK